MATNTDKLANARRTLAETTETAVVITTELDRNRATLESARRNVCVCVCARAWCAALLLCAPAGTSGGAGRPIPFCEHVIGVCVNFMVAAVAAAVAAAVTSVGVYAGWYVRHHDRPSAANSPVHDKTGSQNKGVWAWLG